MSSSLPAPVLLALGATPALPLGACLPTQRLGASGDDDDDDVEPDHTGSGAGGGSGRGTAIDPNGDGSPTGEDCREGDVNIDPGALEWRNGTDADCDLRVGEDLDPYRAHPDADALSAHGLLSGHDRARSASEASRTVPRPAQAPLLTSTAELHA